MVLGRCATYCVSQYIVSLHPVPAIGTITELPALIRKAESVAIGNTCACAARNVPESVLASATRSILAQLSFTDARLEHKCSSLQPALKHY